MPTNVGENGTKGQRKNMTLYSGVRVGWDSVKDADDASVDSE
jgi:hypothetical protein